MSAHLRLQIAQRLLNLDRDKRENVAYERHMMHQARLEEQAYAQSQVERKMAWASQVQELER